jgi:hypothetical protein
MTNLESRYENVFGTKTSKGQLNAGFLLMLLGVVCGIAAVVLTIVGYNVPKGDDNVFLWRELAGVGGALCLTLFPLGVTVALPTRAGMRIAAYIGAVIALLAAVLFIVHYPTHFNVKNQLAAGETQADYLILDVGLFCLGFALLMATLFTSVIGFYLGRLQPVAAASEDEVDDESYGPGYEVPDWVVERDIEYAMKRHGVSWGDGKSGGSSNLNVNVADAVGGGFVVGGLGKARTVQLDAEQVDTGVKGLTTIRPSKKPTLPSEWADDSTRALRALRNKQQAGGAEGAAVLPKSARPGFWARFWAKLTGRSAKVGTSAGSPTAKMSQANLNPVQPPVARKGKTVTIQDEK